MTMRRALGSVLAVLLAVSLSACVPAGFDRRGLERWLGEQHYGTPTGQVTELHDSLFGLLEAVQGEVRVPAPLDLGVVEAVGQDLQRHRPRHPWFVRVSDGDRFVEVSTDGELTRRDVALARTAASSPDVQGYDVALGRRKVTSVTLHFARADGAVQQVASLAPRMEGAQTVDAAAPGLHIVVDPLRMPAARVLQGADDALQFGDVTLSGRTLAVTSPGREEQLAALSRLRGATDQSGYGVTLTAPPVTISSRQGEQPLTTSDADARLAWELADVPGTTQVKLGQELEVMTSAGVAPLVTIAARYAGQVFLRSPGESHLRCVLGARGPELPALPVELCDEPAFSYVGAGTDQVIVTRSADASDADVVRTLRAHPWEGSRRFVVRAAGASVEFTSTASGRAGNVAAGPDRGSSASPSVPASSSAWADAFVAQWNDTAR